MQHLFLSLLKSELLDEPYHGEAPDATTQRRLFLLAKSQDLAHLIGSSLSRAGLLTDEKAKAAFENAGIKALYRYTRLWHGYELVTTLFEESAIPFIPLKGALLRHLYPKPEMRTSSDIDLLVPEERLEEAIELLIERLGFERRKKTSHDVNLVLGDAVNLELHYNIIENDDRLDPMLKKVWEFATATDKGKYEHHLSADYFAFHVVSHACHHFLGGGCGVKPVLDLYFLRHDETYDDAAVRKLVKESNIEIFYEALCTLGEVWLGNARHDRTTSAMEDFIFGGGAYGTLENRAAVGANRKKASGLSYALSRIFIPKQRLASLYPILNNTPFCCLSVKYAVGFVPLHAAGEKELFTSFPRTPRCPKKNAMPSKLCSLTLIFNSHARHSCTLCLAFLFNKKMYYRR